MGSDDSQRRQRLRPLKEQRLAATAQEVMTARALAHTLEIAYKASGRWGDRELRAELIGQIASRGHDGQRRDPRLGKFGRVKGLDRPERWRPVGLEGALLDALVPMKRAGFEPGEAARIVASIESREDARRAKRELDSFIEGARILERHLVSDSIERVVSTPITRSAVAPDAFRRRTAVKQGDLTLVEIFRDLTDGPKRGLELIEKMFNFDEINGR